MQKYFYLPEMIDLIDEPNRFPCQRILKENEEIFKTDPGSSHNHQNWTGGYWDHLREIMNIAVLLHQKMNPLRTLPFSLSDVLLVLFLHDIENHWKYEVDYDGKLGHKKDMDTPETEHWFKNKKLYEFGIVLTAEHKNAMIFAHGELNDYSCGKGISELLTAFCHICDVCTMIWFDHPWEGFEDGWWPAQRVSPKQV